MVGIWAQMREHVALSEVGDMARRAEAMGYDRFSTTELDHDPLLAAGAAVQATQSIEVAIAGLICFPRSPMTTAVAAWDLQEYSRGRFRLGLSPLVPENILQKFSTPWYPPAPRMREYIDSLRAIFRCWQDDAPLNYQGKYYQFSRQQGYAKPKPLEYSQVPIHIGATGPNLAALAGETAAALYTHPTNTTPKYLREVIQPNMKKGAERAGRTQDRALLIANPFTAIASSESEIQALRENYRQFLGTVFSTPRYWSSLEMFGWPDLGPHLKQLVKENRWQDMKPCITDEILNTFVATAHYSEAADVLAQWYGGLVDGIAIPMPRDPVDDKNVAKLIDELRHRLQ
ncbi:MAG: TIGR03617 family F420-dependent LLM class oxidoreductase [Halieaceae bacterium]|jgi:probable F420-dependent oxidoreductase|nr:TIGR03617 family F420-dependent LLM class oxidoreductase [Halieaceae bacterium]